MIRTRTSSTPTTRRAPTDHVTDRAGTAAPRRRILVDYCRCIGCEACDAACSFVNGASRVLMVRTLGGALYPVFCSQCDQPACVRACSRGAIGPSPDGCGIILDGEKCSGCKDKACIGACPYGAMICTGDTTPAVKCDLCRDRAGAGLGPACAAVCPCGAVSLVDRDAAESLQGSESKEIFRRILGTFRMA